MHQTGGTSRTHAHTHKRLSVTFSMMKRCCRLLNGHRYFVAHRISTPIVQLTHDMCNAHQGMCLVRSSWDFVVGKIRTGSVCWSGVMELELINSLLPVRTVFLPVRIWTDMEVSPTTEIMGCILSRVCLRCRPFSRISYLRYIKHKHDLLRFIFCGSAISS